MPITCPIQFPRLSQSEMAKLDYEVMSHAFAAHQQLGCLCDESVYHHSMEERLREAGFSVESELPVTLTFRNFITRLSLDLVVNCRAIYDFKTVSALTPANFTQLLNYLFVTNAARGKLINFRPASVESQFVNSALDDTQRRRFDTDTQDWRGPDEFRKMVEELLADWGTGLDQSLYTQALVHCLGGEESVTRQLPMQLGGVPLGNQRFHLVNDETAFHITTLQDDLGAHHPLQLRKLMVPSPLKALLWINIARHQLTLSTIAE